MFALKACSEIIGFGCEVLFFRNFFYFLCRYCRIALSEGAGKWLAGQADALIAFNFIFRLWWRIIAEFKVQSGYFRLLCANKSMVYVLSLPLDRCL